MASAASCCLNDSVPERRILNAVLPIFAGPIPWSLSASATRDEYTVDSVTDDLNVEKAVAFFLEDMVSISIQLVEISDYTLSPQALRSCREVIEDLLNFLEDLVEDDILDDSRAQDEDLCQQPGGNSNADEKPAPVPTNKGWLLGELLSWIPDILVSPADNIPEIALPPQPQSSFPPAPLIALDTPKEGQHRKLGALGRLLVKRSSSSTESLDTICQDFITLHHGLDSFLGGLARAGAVNACLGDLICDLGGPSPLPPTFNQVSKTQWQDLTSWQLSNQLFHLLQKKTCSNQHHKAKLQLAGFKLDESSSESLSLDMFLSPCTRSPFWQQCQCTAIPKNPFTSRKFRMISDICRSIEDIQSTNNVFNIIFDEDYLWRPLQGETASSYDGASPSVTLGELLEKGYLQEDGNDSTSFDMNDKAVLALSLARCLLHLWDGAWLKAPLRVETIQFLTHSDKIIDIHRPYITRTLGKSQPNDLSSSEPMAIQSSLRAFALLLLEIETGKRILTQSSLPSPDDVEDAIDRVLVQRANKYGRGDYNKAVRGCFHIKAILKRRQRDRPDGAGDDLHQMRQALYEGIVEHLERNFSQVQDQEQALGLRILNLRECTTDKNHLDPCQEEEEQSCANDSTESTTSDTRYSSPEVAQGPNNTLHETAHKTTLLDRKPLTKSKRAGRVANILERFTSFRYRRVSGKADLGKNTLPPEPTNLVAVNSTAHKKCDEPSSAGNSAKRVRRKQKQHGQTESVRISPIVSEYEESGGDCTKPKKREDFKIAIFCALPEEADAVIALFDQHWKRKEYGKKGRDPNSYTLGAIGAYNVVLVHLPGMGKGVAASAASSCYASFAGIKLALVVGVCGGVPFGPSQTERILGDVVISNGLVQYDFGRQYPDEFTRKGTIHDNQSRPNPEVRGFLARLKGIQCQNALVDGLQRHLINLRNENAYEYPGVNADILYEPSYSHRHRDASRCPDWGNSCGKGKACHTARGLTCEELACDRFRLVERQRLRQAVAGNGERSDSSLRPVVHIGTIGCGDKVMKSAEERDMIARNEDLIAFEMEGVGVWDHFPCLVIKGICDYADCHKSKRWQSYAMATAAACMKSVLEQWG